MSDVNQFLLIVGVLLSASILIGHVSRRFGMPLLLVFLLIGMTAGEDGPGGIRFDDFGVAFLVANLALAVILLDGGMRTQLQTFRVALRPALSLATVGVVITAGLVGVAGHFMLGLDWPFAFLLGSIVASTDAAAVFALLRDSGTRLNDRVASTLEIESGVNDPMAVFLTVAMIEVIRSGAATPDFALLVSLVQQFGLGVIIGVGAGYLLSRMVQTVHVGEGLYALLIASGGLLIFAGCNLLGGSGFLAVYLTGLVVGNRRLPGGENVLRAMDGLAWLAQAGMFLLLGLLVTPSNLFALGWWALGVAVVLMVVARPVAVALSLAPFRFPPREMAYISWVGLRGAVPIVLAIFPTMAGIDRGHVFFDVAFFVVLVSLILQGSTLALGARVLGIALPSRIEPIAHGEIELTRQRGLQLLEVRVPEDWPWAGTPVRELRLPADTQVLAVWREAMLVADVNAHLLQTDDAVLCAVPPESSPALAQLFTQQPAQGAPSQRSVFGDFTLDADVSVGDLEMAYGFVLARDDSERERKLGDWLQGRLRRRPVAGDRMRVDRIELTVREVRDGHITRVGLKLSAE